MPDREQLRVSYTDSQRSIDKFCLVDVHTGQVIKTDYEYESGVNVDGYADGTSYDSQRTIVEEDNSIRIHSTADSKELCVLPTTDTFACWSPCEDLLVTTGVEANARLWKRRRPEPWWGMVWLWEFWLVAVVATALVRSVWRDRRAFAA